MPTRQVTLTLNQARRITTLLRAAERYRDARRRMNRLAALSMATGREFDALIRAEQDLLVSARHCDGLRIMPSRRNGKAIVANPPANDDTDDAGETAGKD